MKLRVEEIAGAVSSEHAPGAIGAVCGGRKPDDDEISLRVAKGRHGTAPVGPIAVRSALGAGYFLAITHQAGALAALRDFALERNKACPCHHSSRKKGTIQ